MASEKHNLSGWTGTGGVGWGPNSIAMKVSVKLVNVCRQQPSSVFALSHSVDLIGEILRAIEHR